MKEEVGINEGSDQKDSCEGTGYKRYKADY